MNDFSLCRNFCFWLNFFSASILAGCAMELISEPRYNEGPRDRQNMFAKTVSLYRGSLKTLDFTIIGAKNIIH